MIRKSDSTSPNYTGGIVASGSGVPGNPCASGIHTATTNGTHCIYCGLPTDKPPTGTNLEDLRKQLIQIVVEVVDDNGKRDVQLASAMGPSAFEQLMTLVAAALQEQDTASRLDEQMRTKLSDDGGDVEILFHTERNYLTQRLRIGILQAKQQKGQE